MLAKLYLFIVAFLLENLIKTISETFILIDKSNFWVLKFEIIWFILHLKSQSNWDTWKKT